MARFGPAKPPTEPVQLTTPVVVLDSSSDGPPAATEALAIVRHGDHWIAQRLRMIDGLVCEVEIIERSYHRDLAQQAVRRAAWKLGL